MTKTQRVAPSPMFRLAAAGVVAFGLLTVGGTAVAIADVSASGGAGTIVDKDGTQGDLKPAVQGTQDSDGDQDAYDNISPIATPQYRGVGHK